MLKFTFQFLDFGMGPIDEIMIAIFAILGFIVLGKLVKTAFKIIF